MSLPPTTPARQTLAFTLGLASGAAAAALLTRERLHPVRGRVALVTGGSRGLGYLIARDFLDLGAHVVICARDAEELEVARARLHRRALAAAGGLPGRVLPVVCDVGDAQQVEAMVRRVERELGGVDFLVNNAGVMHVGPEESMTDDDYRAAMDAIFWGTVHCTRAVLPAMRRRGTGRIANVASIGGKVPLPHMVPYAAAKFAVVGFSEALAADVRRYGVRVTTVVPGFMRTGSPINAYFKGDARREYAWFGAGSATVFTSMNAVKAAQRIVLAMRRGESEVVLSWQAKLMRFVHAVAPRAGIEAVALLNRALPKGASRRARRGMDVDEGFEDHPLYRSVYRNAWRNNEYAAGYSSAEEDGATT